MMLPLSFSSDATELNVKKAKSRLRSSAMASFEPPPCSATSYSLAPCRIRNSQTRFLGASEKRFS